MSKIKNWVLEIVFTWSLESEYLKKNYGKIVSIGKTKRAIFIANIATNLLKDYDFANIGSIDILKCRLK